MTLRIVVTAAVVLGEPRPLPVLPASLVPFSIAPDVCRDGRVPVVSLKVFDVLAQPVAVLRLRSRARELLDATRLSCGTFVATWGGAITPGDRLAPSGIYYLQLSVESQTADGRPITLRDTERVIVPHLP